MSKRPAKQEVEGKKAQTHNTIRAAPPLTGVPCNLLPPPHVVFVSHLRPDAWLIKDKQL